MLNNLLRLLSITILLAVFLFSQNTFAQLTGTKSIPGNYATLSAAVTDLNTLGVGPGGVTFNIAAGYTESITAPISITATGTSGNPIVFQKNGAGANPVITRTDAGSLATSVFGGDGDAIIKLNGTDYITFNGINVTATDAGIEYGYYTSKPDGANGCQFVTITNCVVTMNKGTSAYVTGVYISNGTTSLSSAVGVTVTAATGINSNINIIGNTIQNVHAGIQVRGSSATGFYDSDVIIGQSGSSNIIQNFGGANATTTYGVYFLYVNNPTVAYNTINNVAGGGTAHGSTLYGVFYSTVLGNVVGSNNDFNLDNNSASSLTYYIYNSNTVTTETYNNNTFAAGPLVSTGTVYLIYASNATNNKTISGNQLSGAINRTAASGSFYCYYNLGSPTGGTETVTNNIFSNITVAGSSSLYGIYSNTTTSQSRVWSGNTISNFTGGTGTTYTIYAVSTLSNQVYNNNIYNISAGGTVYGLYFTGTNPTVYGNNIYNLSTTGSACYGIYNNGTGLINCYKNQVYNITVTNTSATLYGIYVLAGTTNYVYNNFVSDLKTPTANAAIPLAGIYVSGGTSVGLYYNTVFLNASSSGALFGSAGIYASTTPTLDMRNNVVVNLSTPAGATGYTTAYRRSSTTLTSYASTSNNNDFYAGTPGTNNLIFYDGTNSDQTMAAYKTRVASRDAASFSENPPFINVVTTPYNLHMSNSIATQTESGGTTISSPIAITDDFDGNTRNAITPDVGADEFGGLLLDLTPPVISYTPLLNIGSTSVRSLVVNVTDVSGVPTTAPGWPNLYWKKNFAGSWTAVTPSSVVSGNYTFNFGSGVAVGDTVFYYVVAQDAASTPNVGAMPSGGAGGFSINPPAASTPPTTPYSYLITPASLSGTYTVGLALFNSLTGNNITFEKHTQKVMREVIIPDNSTEKTKNTSISDALSLSGKTQLVEVEEVTLVPMQNGKPFEGDLFVKKADYPELNYPEGTNGVYATITAAVADLNLRGVSGATTFSLVDAVYTSATETYPLVIDVTNVNVPTAVNTVTFKPAVGVSPTISGNATSLFKLNGADYITFDGSNTVGGTTRDMTLLDSIQTLSGVIWIASKSASDGASFNTVKNCNIKGFSGSTTTAGIILGSGTTMGNPADAPNSNNIIQNNNVTAVQNGVYHSGYATTLDQNISITNNIFGSDVVASKLGFRGLILINAQNFTVSNNTILGVVTSTTSTAHGVQLSGIITGGSITRNKISDLKNTNTGGYSATGITLGASTTASNVLVANNFIWDVAGYGWTSLTTDMGSGINIASGGGYNIYHNSINLNTNQTLTTGINACVLISSSVTTAASLDLRDNIITSFQTVGAQRYAVLSNAANTVFSNINYNDYYTLGANLGYIGSTNRLDLAAWVTGTGQDANSISGDPKFLSATDLHIDPAFNVVSNNGFYLASVPTDIDGQTRNNPPDIGADEYTYIPPTVNDPTGVAATAISQNQINVAFTRNGNNNNVLIVWNATGSFTVPTGAPPAVGQPFAGGTVLYYGPTSPAQHTGLTASTLYYYKAFSYDGSLYSPGVVTSATTLAAPLSLPYSQDFEGTFPPTGWQNYGSKTWSQTSTGGVGGTKGARVVYSPAGTANLQTPNVILPASPTYKIRFWWKDNDISARPLGDGPEIAGYDTTYFEISTNGGTNWTTLSFLSAASTQSAYVESVNDLTSYAGQTVVFRWRDVSDGSLSAYGVGLDNVSIEEIPTGPVFNISPTSYNYGSIISGNSSAPINFTISNTGSTDLIINTGGVTLTGTNPNQFSLGSITYPITIGAGGNAVVTVTFSPTSTGLKSANLQIVHNAPGSPSTVALTGNGLPQGILFEDFTDVNALARWKVVNRDGGANSWVRTTAKYNSAPASAGSTYESSTLQNDDWLISPKLIVSAGDSLTFYHSIQSASYPESLYVKVGTTNDPNTGTWTNLAVIYDATTTWKYKKYDLSAYAGQQIYVAFVNRGLDEWVVYVDDIMGPIVYVPAVDLAFTQFYQTTGLPVPKPGEQFSDYKISMSETMGDQKPFTKLLNNVSGDRSSNVNNTRLLDSDNGGIPVELNNVSMKAFIKNLGLNSASYNLSWNVNGSSQTPYTGPSVAPGATDSTVLTYSPSNRGTFLTSGNITVTADENPDNNSKQFRMRVYPDVFTRTIYDRGDNVVDTWVGWGVTTTQMKAGVRFTATADVKLAGVDFIYNTETVTSGDIIVQVRAAGTTTTAPGDVLYTTVFNTAAYFAGGGDYVHLPFGSDAPVIANGSDYWITVKFPLGISYPGGVHNNGFTTGRSFYEGSTDTTVWNALVITTERAWIMRSVEVAAGPATFQLSVNVLNSWNMVSIPGLHPTDQNVNTWWNFRDPLASVYKWSGGAYNPVTTATPTEGYWLLHSGARTYNTGDEWPAGGIQLVNHDPITVSAGWNMIGGYDNSASVSGLTTTPPGLIVPGTVYGWNGGYYNPTNLEPGYGYWILLTGSGVINPPTALKGGSTAKETNTEGWGKIIVTDASGKSYTLYSVKGEVNLMEYQLPPLPPAGLFDVRFGSGRKAEDLKTSQTIEMQGLVYPIVVKSENMDIRLQDVSGTVVNQSLKSGESVTISNSSVSKLMVSATVIPDKYSLEQNYPNPFNPSTVISFSLPEDASNVRLTIYDALGQKVAELVNGKLEAGKYQYSWNAGNNATGLYIYELRTDKFVSVKKMLMVK